MNKLVKYIGNSLKGTQRDSNKDRCGFFISEDGTECLAFVLDGVSSEVNAIRGVTMAYNFLKKQFYNCYLSRFSLSDLLFDTNNKLIQSKYSNPYTTICSIYIDLHKERIIHTASLGDTRCYVVTPQSIKNVTRDHSLGGNIITHCLGMEWLDKSNIFYEPIDGKTLIICSDGFYNVMEKDLTAFHRVFINRNTKKTLIDKLVSGKNIDDASYVLIRIDDV
jgi:serine/threonine protein phosphatase PrpC